MPLSVSVNHCWSLSFFPLPFPFFLFPHNLFSLTVSPNCLCILLECIAIYFEVCLFFYPSLFLSVMLCFFLFVCVPPCHSLCLWFFNNIYTLLAAFLLSIFIGICFSTLFFLSPSVVISVWLFQDICLSNYVFSSRSMSLNSLSLCLCLSLSCPLSFLSLFCSLFIYFCLYFCISKSRQHDLRAC